VKASEPNGLLQPLHEPFSQHVASAAGSTPWWSFHIRSVDPCRTKFWASKDRERASSTAKSLSQSWSCCKHERLAGAIIVAATGHFPNLCQAVKHLRPNKGKQGKVSRDYEHFF
jgi:hypothetical protein